MSFGIGPAVVGQWYKHLDKGDLFVVTGYDERSHSIETQGANGDLDEIDEETWNSLPLELAAPSEDWTEARETVEADDTALGLDEVEKLLSR